MSCAAVEELVRTLRKGSSFLAGTYQTDFPKESGNRLQAAPGSHCEPGSTLPSGQTCKYNPGSDPHQFGLALDIILFANRPAEREFADGLVDIFMYLREKMKWGVIIYNHVTTDGFGGPKPHTGANKHTTHIHIDWGASNAGTTGFAGDVERELKSLMLTLGMS